MASINRFSPDGSRLAVTSADGRLTIWNSNSEIQHQYSPSSHLSAEITALAWCPAPNAKKKKKKGENETPDILALGTSAGTVVLYSIKQGGAITTLEAALATVRVHCVIWSHSAKSLLVGSQDGAVSLFSALGLDLSARLSTGKDPVFALALTPDDKRLISGSRQLQVWDVKTQNLLQTFTGHAGEVTQLRAVEMDGTNYILSGAVDDRNISVWKIDENCKKPRKASSTHSAALNVNETILDMDVLQCASDTDILTSVITNEGSVQLFQHDVTTKSKSPVTPNYTLQIAAEGKKLTQIPICGSVLKNNAAPALTFAYGSSAKVIIEEMNVSDLQKSHLLARKMPTLQIGGETAKNFTKVVEPSLPESVKYLVAGNPVAPARGTKRKPANNSIETMSLEERLSFLNTKNDIEANMPKSDTLAQLLVQGLQSKDLDILNSVLDRDDERLIDNTVRILPVECVLPLLSNLYYRIQSKGSGSLACIRWTKCVLQYHASFLISATNVQKEMLLPMNDMITARAANFLPVLKLKGKMEMIQGQMERNRTGSNIDVDRAPLLVYQDESDDEYSDAIKNLVTTSQGDGDDSDYLEFLSNAESDESDEEDEDDIQAVSLTNGINGHDDVSDMEQD